MPHPRFMPGNEVVRVSRRDAVGVVVGQPTLINHEWWYSVRFGNQRSTYPERDLELHQGGQDVRSLLLGGVFATRETLSKIVTFTKLRQPLENTLYAYRAARIEFHEHQFKPLLKLLESASGRLLIADEVGLGKTIEAGLIYQELLVRGELNRVLVVCPSRLRSKWQEEMARRFHEEFAILDAAGFRRFLHRVQMQGSAVALRAICSLETLRGAGLLEALEAATPPLDLLIIDEAHHMRNPGRRSSRLGQVLLEAADTGIMLTATPVHLGNENLFQLLHILDPTEFADIETFRVLLDANRPVLEAERALRQGPPADFALCRRILHSVESGPAARRFVESPVYHEVTRKLSECDPSNRRAVVEIQRDLVQLSLLDHILTRTRKRDVPGQRPQRTASVMPVDWSPGEQSLYDHVTDYCRQRALAASASLGVASWFPVITLQRQVASCIPAAIEHYLSAAPDEAEDGLSDVTLGDLTENGATETSPGRLRDDPRLREIFEHARSTIQRDTKFDVLLAQLRQLDDAEPDRKIIVFSYFKKTLHYLQRRLREEGYNCILLTGDVPSKPLDPDNDERGQRIRQFRMDPAVRILLSSEVGSEGLDFQFASILVNYDLPWNPMVVEQRIGRLDRMGQAADRILIFNFIVSGTIEERILGRLYARIRIFEESIGDLEDILGEEIQTLTLELLSNRLTPEEETRRIEEAAQALERRRQSLRDLDQQAAQFIGHDAYFHDQLRKITENRRYVGAEELEVLVTDFLAKEFPRATWERAADPRCFHLRLTDDLADLLRRESTRRHGGTMDMGDTLFVDRATRRRGVPITFHDETGLANSEVELLNSQHIFIQCIVAYYEQHLDRLHPVARLQVRCSDVPAGDYTYFLYLVRQEAVRPGRTLEAIFISLADRVALGEAESERLLSQMVTDSQVLDDSPVPDEAVFQEAQTVFGTRVTVRRENLERVNSDIVTRQVESLRVSYERRRQQKQSLLERAVAAGQSQQYIRMLEGTLRNMEADHRQRLAQLEQRRAVSISQDLFAAGVVRVW